MLCNCTEAKRGEARLTKGRESLEVVLGDGVMTRQAVEMRRQRGRMRELRQVQRVTGWPRQKSVQEGQPYVREQRILLRALLLGHLGPRDVLRCLLTVPGVRRLTGIEKCSGLIEKLRAPPTAGNLPKITSPPPPHPLSLSLGT